MRFVCVLLFLMSSTTAFAQVRMKLNYNSHWQLTEPDSAVYIRVCIYDTTNAFFAGPVADLYLSGKPQMTGTYKGGKKSGNFTSYFENGQIESTGAFENDLRHGVWRDYYSDGKLKLEVEFFPNGDQPRIMTFNDPDGKPRIQNGTGDWEELVELVSGEKIFIKGKYKNYNKDGEWVQESPPGKILITESYKKGKVTKYDYNTTGVYNDYSLPLPWKFLETEAFDATKNASFEIYPALKLITVNGRVRRKPLRVDHTVQDKVYELVDVQPEVVGGLTAMVKFIGNNIKYPVLARRTGIEGVVFVEFIVDVGGKLRNIKVLKGISLELDEEALRVVDLMNKELPWSPGMFNGQPVNVRFVLPIKFTLGYERR
jgi:TonB family protein